MTPSTGIVVEPHTYEETLPRRAGAAPRSVERTNGYIARRGPLQAWSTSQHAALVLLGHMERAKETRERRQDGDRLHG